MKDEFELLTYIDQALEQKEHLLKILNTIQEKLHYIPSKAIDEIYSKGPYSYSKLHEVLRFYSGFRLKPAGKHSLEICVGTACHVRNAQGLYNDFKSYLKIPFNDDTDPDKLFTIKKVACLGCCMLAPAIRIDSEIYGKLTSSTIPDVLNQFLNTRTRKSRFHSTELKEKKIQIGTCLCSSCRAAGSADLAIKIGEEIKNYHFPISFKSLSCTGRAYETPFLYIQENQKKRIIGNVEIHHVHSILNKITRPPGLLNKAKLFWNNFLNYLLIGSSQTKGLEEPRPVIDDEAGIKIATLGSGESEALNLENYKGYGGFEALEKALTTLTDDDILREIELSELRGRGGAGYMVYKKWKQIRNSPDGQRYLVANGDEGDPGAFMDRMILESFPFRVLEGIIISALVLKIPQAYIYLRHEYNLATKRLKKAIKILKEAGYIEKKLPNSDFSLEIHVIEGAGAFVCGEETALLASIEAKRGSPRFRPPYPASKGLFNEPTLINNVESFANIPAIILNGGSWFANTGTSSSKGTKTFALAGKIKKSALIEVPMGMTIESIVFDIGGGIENNRAFKAVQIGGPSGGCIPASLSHIKVDYESLKGAGSMMGSGGMVVLDDRDCMVDMALYFTRFSAEESCGQCTPCRLGTIKMQRLLEALCRGEADEKLLNELHETALHVKEASLCGLGQSAPNPVLTTLRYFKEEYKAHLKGICPAGTCSALIHYEISQKCIGCTLCAQICPAKAIIMNPHQRHYIQDPLCVRCGSCKAQCPEQAIQLKSQNQVID